MKKSLITLLAASAIVLIGCNQAENLTGSVTIKSPSQPVALSTTSTVITTIDDFTFGGGSWEACGNSVYVLHSDASILGGNRQLKLRDGHSCVLGGRARIRIDATAGTMAWYGATAQEQHAQYGTLIGSLGESWSPSPPSHVGSPMNLALTLDDEILVEAVNVLSNFIQIRLRTGSGQIFVQNFTLTTGTNLFALSDFPGLTAAAAADIDGISFSGSVRTSPENSPTTGNIFTLFAIQKTVIIPDVCPEGYTDGAAFESFFVNSNGTSSPVYNPPSLTPLIAGRPYIAKATGTYSFHIFRSDTWGDAGYRTGDNWATQDGPNPLFGLAIDGVIPNWGSYNAGHEYKTIFYGTGAAQGFRILDDAYGDNSGGLNVTLSTCEPTSQPTTTTVTFGAGPFVYNGSAFTATASVSPAEAGAATITYSGDCTNAGNTCTATATFAGSDGYDPSSASASITIDKAPTTTSASFGSGPFVYTGSAFTATASVSPAAAGSATIAYSGDCTNAGNTCSATATYAGNGNYLPSSATAGITIAKAATTTSVSFGSGPFIYTGSAFTATSSVSPAAAGSATIAYAGDCVYAGNTCTATATYAESGNFLPSAASTGIVIQYPVATNADMCKKGGWQYATDDLGNLFKNQGDCVSYVATKGKNKGAGR